MQILEIIKFKKKEKKLRQNIVEELNALNKETKIHFEMYDGDIAIKEIRGKDNLVVDENGFEYYYEDFNTNELINLYEALFYREKADRGQQLHESIRKHLQKKENKDKINKEKQKEGGQWKK